MTREECIERLQEIVDQDKNKILVRVHVGYLVHAIKYLKELEPVKPVYQGDDSYTCDNCGETVGWEELDVFGIDPVKYKYCPGCGRMVKWDD